MCDEIIIEDNVVISMQNTFITHLDMSRSNLAKIYPQKQSPIKIKRNTYIGAKSLILQGVTLGENSFVSAGSVVTKNVEPYTMVAGIPARVIKRLC